MHRLADTGRYNAPTRVPFDCVVTPLFDAALADRE